MGGDHRDLEASVRCAARRLVRQAQHCRSLQEAAV
jgi:hypothetical protein